MKTIREEWRKLFKNKILFISFITICFIPILYASFFLKSIWDPYGMTKNLPVAFVNEDRGTEFEGKRIDVGNQIETELRDNKDLDWHFVSSAKGQEGLKDNKYYMVVTVPENFSQEALSVLDVKPDKMKIDFETNPSYNFIGEVIGETAMLHLQKQITDNIVKAYAGAIFDNLVILKDGMHQASDGAGQINGGLSQVSAGNEKLLDGLNSVIDGSDKLNSGAFALKGGISQYTSGANQINAGINQANSGALALLEGSNELVSHNKEISQGVQMLADKVDDVNNIVGSIHQQNNIIKTSINNIVTSVKAGNGINQADVDNLNNALNNLVAILKQAGELVNAGDLEAAIQAQINIINTSLNNIKTAINNGQPIDQNDLLNIKSANLEIVNIIYTAIYNFDGASLFEKLNQQVKKLNDGIQAYLKGSQQLNAGIKQLTQGTNKLKTGSNQLVSKNGQLLSGANQLFAGTDVLQTGVLALRNGDMSLAEALVKLNTGSEQLASSLKEGATKLDAIKVSAKNQEMVSSPLETNQSHLSEVPNYGYALAPYVLSLALYVGCLVFNFIMPVRKVSVEGASTISWWASKVSLGLVGATFMAIIETVIMMALGIDPLSHLDYWITALATVYAYMFLIMFLAITFDNPGRFVAMVLLIVQLAGAGGTFPMPLTYNFFNVIHPFLPMTYSIYGFRDAIAGGMAPGLFSTSITILVTIALVSLVLMYLGMRVLHKKQRAGISQLDDNQKLGSTNYDYQ